MISCPIYFEQRPRRAFVEIKPIAECVRRCAGGSRDALLRRLLALLADCGDDRIPIHLRWRSSLLLFIVEAERRSDDGYLFGRGHYFGKSTHRHEPPVGRMPVDVNRDGAVFVCDSRGVIADVKRLAAACVGAEVEERPQGTGGLSRASMPMICTLKPA